MAAEVIAKLAREIGTHREVPAAPRGAQDARPISGSHDAIDNQFITLDTAVRTRGH